MTGGQAGRRVPRQGRRVQDAGARSGRASRIAREAVAETTRAFVDRFGTFGYAFASVDAAARDRPRQRPGGRHAASPSRSAASTCGASTSPATRARATRSIRREFRQFESSWYDGRKIKLSRDRVDRLGYFSEVNVDTNEVPGSPDQVDLTITVKEKPTGNLLARRRLLSRPTSCR